MNYAIKKAKLLPNWMSARLRARTFATELFEFDYYKEQTKTEHRSKLPALREFMSIRRPSIFPTRLFDPSWYLLKNPDVESAGINPFLHYLIHGWREDRDPHPFFSAIWYSRQRTDPTIPPILEFFRKIQSGSAPPHPLFDATFWDPAQANPSLAYHQFLISANDTTSPLRSPHPLVDLSITSRISSFCGNWRDIVCRRQLSIETPLFDANWYLQENKDVAAHGIDPLFHYVVHGDREGRFPNRMFDPSWYRSEYRLQDATLTLSHYITSGASQGYWPCPVFDAQSYLEARGVSEGLASTNALQLFVLEDARRDHEVCDTKSLSRLGAKPFIVEISYERVACPKDLGESDDSRQIAVGFEHIEIRDEFASKTLAAIDFHTNGNARDYILFGVSQIEGWGAWSLGSKTAILMWPETFPAGQVSVEITGVAHRSLQGLQISIASSNGYELKCAFVPRTKLYLTKRDQAASRSVRFLDLLVSPLQNVAPALPLEEIKQPFVSVIILNYNRAQLSILSALSVLRSEPKRQIEVIIADNGSAESEIEILKASTVPFRLVEVGCNRYFGEGNNIAFEQSRGPLVLFLNNDAFVTPGLIDELASVIESDGDVGAVGPFFRYPDGRPQEAGAFVGPSGVAVQRGKYDQSDLLGLNGICKCDYVSAACLMVRRDDFLAVGGFDFRYDPAYYEDSDLCFKLLALGKHTVVSFASTCYHIESATTSDPKRSSGANKSVEVNKKSFLSRWKPYLVDRRQQNLPVIPHYARSPADVELDLMSAVYTPYPLVIGGGERYIISAASVLGESGGCYFVTPNKYSNIRLRNVATSLGLETTNISTRALSMASDIIYKFGLTMGNDIYPSVVLPAEKRWYHCQFPFPRDRPFASKYEADSALERLRAHRGIIVNSEFTREAVLRALRKIDVSLPVKVCYPSVDFEGLEGGGVGPSKEQCVISVGRFSDLGHSKRQDVIIEAFKRTPQKFRDNWRLVLCGSIASNCSPEYVEALYEAAKGYPIEFVLGPSRAEIIQLLLRSSVYVHATGFGVENPDDHHLCEHFGISVVEAIAAGCQCVAYEIGGPKEIFDLTGTGRLFASTDELARLMCASEVGAIGNDARVRALNAFNHGSFRRSLMDAIS